jgi:hypothetical protein
VRVHQVRQAHAIHQDATPSEHKSIDRQPGGELAGGLPEIAGMAVDCTTGPLPGAAAGN